MSMQTEWTSPDSPAPAGERLRERKKRLMRQQLSDTATRMFLNRGFDAVRVAEVAEACGVSEKTVFNYFPTKESLILDRLGGLAGVVRGGEPARHAVKLAVKDRQRRLDRRDGRVGQPCPQGLHCGLQAVQDE